MSISACKPKGQRLLFTLLVITLLTSCATNLAAPERPFATEDLLLKTADVPDHWHLARIAPLGPSIGFGDENDREVMFTQPNDPDQLVFASHMALQFDSNRQAARWYSQMFPKEFNDNSVAIDEPWKTFPELSYRSAVAVQFHVACTINNVAGRKQVCKMMAQYEEYVVIFRSTIKSYSVSVAGFNELVRRIDEIMVAHLQTG